MSDECLRKLQHKSLKSFAEVSAEVFAEVCGGLSQTIDFAAEVVAEVCGAEVPHTPYALPHALWGACGVRGRGLVVCGAATGGPA